MKSILRRAAALLVVLLISFGALRAYAAEAAFPDIDGHWAQSYVEALAKKGIVAGMGDGLFHPNQPVTTAQFVTMVMRCGVGIIPPTDTHWASGYIKEAYDRDIVIGNDLDTLDSPLIRRFAARIGLEALRSLWKEEDEENILAADKLEDLYSCNQCVWSVAQVFMKGIMIGMPDNLFHGDDNFTRAEACVVIMRMIDPELRVPQKIELPEEVENGIITPDEALRLSNTYQNVLLVDVRPAEAFAAGHIPNSTNIPLSDIMNNLSLTAIANTEDPIVIVYCQKGVTSLKAYEILKEAGYANVFNLGGLDDWPYEVVSTI